MSVQRIDQNDVIVFVDEGWKAFARENDSAHLAEEALGTLLWDSIAGDDVREIYRAILSRVRVHDESFSFPFRCDSPSHRRHMHMRVVPCGHLNVEFVTTLLKEEPRDVSIIAMQDYRSASEEILRMCSWCKKIQLEKAWEDIDTTISQLEIFMKPLAAPISHVICEDCAERIRCVLS